MHRIAVAVLTALLAAAQAAADPWPIKNFQVVEMTEEELANDTGGVFNDAINAVVGASSDDFAGDPTRTEQRRQMEEYLRQCADMLEAWGFPPPALGRIVELENGELAYRVYSLSSVGSSKYVPPEGGDGVDAGHLRLHLVGADGDWRVDFQDFATIAHELFHAVQYNTRFFSVEPGWVGDWITEGQAEAVGIDLAWLHAPDDASRDSMEWGRRDYARHLAIARRNPGGTGPPYETSSFWRYLAERDYLNRTAGPTIRPGIAAPGGRVHYGYLASILSNPPQPRDCSTNDDRCPLEMQWLNAGLLGYDVLQEPLRDAFAEFAITLAGYGDPGGRARDETASSPLGTDYWRSGVLGCVNQIVDGPILDHRETLRMNGISARCIVVPDLFRNESELFVEARSESSELLDQVLFGLAGDGESATPMLSDDERARGETRTIHTIELTPGRENVLIFANIARDAPETDDQELEIILSTERASLGVNSDGSDTSAADIGAPLPIEFDLITPAIIRPPAELSGDVYVGTGQYEGVVEPCFMSVTLVNTETRETSSILMLNSGAVRPQDYFFADDPDDMVQPEDTPGRPHGEFLLGPVNMPELDRRKAFKVVSGVLNVESVTGTFMRATATMFGVNERWDSTAEREVVDHEISITVQIVAEVGPPYGIPPDSDQPYACLAGDP